MTRVTFADGRIGRSTDVEPLELDAETIFDVEQAILRYARKYLISTTIWLDNDAHGGDVWAGMRKVAHFTIETAQEAIG